MPHTAGASGTKSLAEEMLIDLAAVTEEKAKGTPHQWSFSA
jgi:hypothetical protein